MKVYKVSFRSMQDSSNGFEYYASRIEANKAAKKFIKLFGDEAKVDLIEVNQSKKGIIAALNCHGSHPDNG